MNSWVKIIIVKTDFREISVIRPLRPAAYRFMHCNLKPTGRFNVAKGADQLRAVSSVYGILRSYRIMNGYMVLRNAKSLANWVIAILLLFAGCSDRPQKYTSDNLEILFQVDSEPLFDNVNFICLCLAGTAGQTVYDTSFSYDPSSELMPQLLVEREIEPSSICRAWFYDSTGRPLYRGQEVFGNDIDPILTIQLRQFGNRTAADVKILRDAPPWDSYALDSALTSMGLTAGDGAGEFQVYSSGDLPALGPDPLGDLLIISNDQPQGYYDNIYLGLDIIRDFVSRGGTLLWETCDLAWNFGSYESAGIDSFPGGILNRAFYDFSNFKTGNNYLLTESLDDSLNGNYASNKFFVGVPDSAIVYMTNSDGNPTLLSLKYGFGTIFYSGQPLEYNFDRRNDYNSGLILPEIIGFILGREWDIASFAVPHDTFPAGVSSSR